MADTNTSSTVPEWFIAAMAIVIGIIVLELVTIAALVIFILRNWRYVRCFRVWLLHLLLLVQ